ncbi:FKBP-type peptidyl-prolyl cis-trans isomerase [Williamsia deligens]|uniref:Peptidyl-prolyl cis-trans isomerase n=1 Tax=Williamsia deligens TaxID=321325 RepID=A0ABW3G3Y1_9NOCA|nr:FKBP-type peptidyl-prolyl cis-trans isomerase [Williamsia deligens]MCP2194383.1 peptidylprolyl isomerase [Williamsia deligens]
MRRELRNATAAVSLAVAVALVGAACGDSDSGSSSASSTTATETTAATAADTAAPTSAAPVQSGTPGSDGIPTITANATDTGKEPTIAAGTGTPPTDLRIADLKTGDGRVATAADTVSVRYVGALYSDGSVFDASWKQGDTPVDFPLSGVVPGFAQGIEGMKVGGRREIVIPPALGYGDQSQPGLPAGSTLVFVVDLVGIS